jgi:hypothetical protein
MSGERLRLVRQGPLAAIVGEFPRAPAPSPANLRHYDRVMRVLSARLPAVLPARFGTCFGDPDELRFVLRSRRASLARALARVRQRVQMTVRVIERPGARPPAGGPGTGLPAGAAFRQEVESGTAYLRARAARAARERDVPGFEPVRKAIQRWVRDERIEKRAGVLTVYHLVPRASAATYRRAIERAAADADAQIVISGPWPAYAFADGWAS